MTTIPYPVDREGIERILRFANADLSNTEHVAALAEWGRSSPNSNVVILPNWPVPNKPLNRGVLSNQERLIAILNEIAAHSGCTAAIDEKLDRVLRRITETKVFYGLGGMDVFFTEQTVAQWYSFGIAALRGAQMDDLIRRCKSDDCGNFFVAWPGKRGRAGKPRVYCCDAHRESDKRRRRRARLKREAASRGITI